MAGNILFLTLRVFSATGGIEKVCKVVCKSVCDLAKQQAFFDSFTVLSMYDKTRDLDNKYIDASKFDGFDKQKLSFARAAISKGISSKIIVLSHINLLSIGYIVKIISPKSKLVMFAHGIEVWGKLSYFKKRMLQKCDTILSVSNFTTETLVAEHRIPPEKIVILNNCLDPFLPLPLTGAKPEQLQHRYGINKNDLVLLTLTRLSSRELYKGYDSVLLAVKTLKSKFPAIKYLIVGKYDSGEKKRLDDLIEKAGLSGSVIFSGYIEDEDLAKHYRLADLYVMPSKKEGFGIVFIEAMYYGLPVIAGNKDGSADALLNGKLGMLVNPDNQQEITSAIESVLTKGIFAKPDTHVLELHFGFEGYKQRLASIFKNLSDW